MTIMAQLDRLTRRGRLAVVTALITLAVCCSPVPTLGQRSDPVRYSECRRTFENGDKLSHDTNIWLSSVTRSLDGQEFILSDALNRRLLVYAENGELRLVIKAESLAGRELTVVPSILATRDDSYLVEIEDGNLVELNERFSVIRNHDLMSSVTRGGWQLGGLFAWVPYDSGSKILAYGDLKRGNEWMSAVLEIPLEDPSSYRVLQPIASGSLIRHYFLYSVRPLATIAEKAFFLAMGEKAEVLTPHGVVGLDRAREMMKDDPNALSNSSEGVPVPGWAKASPNFPEDLGPQSARETFEAIGRASTIVGLFGWEGDLLLLARQPDDVGGTKWSLSKIDPSTKKILYERQLPTNAPNLYVLPGDENWLVVERGVVEELGVQEILGFELIPASEIRDLEGDRMLRCLPGGVDE